MKKFIVNLKALYKSLTSTTHIKLGRILNEKNLFVSTAESCTGGLVSSRLTDAPGSSAYIKENYVTYSYGSKEEILGVKHETLMTHGAVSRECAYEMAEGLMKRTKCDMAICTTGIAGPTVDEGKPAGLIYISIGYKDKIVVDKFNFDPLLSRRNMKFTFSEQALLLAIEQLCNL